MTLFATLAVYCFTATLFDSFVIARTWPFLGEAEFPAYHRALASRIEWFFALPLLLLTLFNTLLLWNRPAVVPKSWVWWTLGLLTVVWLVSALVLIPMQLQFDQRMDRTLMQRLFALDWLRVVPFGLYFGFTVAMFRRVFRNF